MKFFILSAQLLGISSAQSLAGLPTCACKSHNIYATRNDRYMKLALRHCFPMKTDNDCVSSSDSCVSNSIPASCNLAPACICSSTSFIQGVTCCVAKACDKADQEGTIPSPPRPIQVTARHCPLTLHSNHQIRSKYLHPCRCDQPPYGRRLRTVHCLKQ